MYPFRVSTDAEAAARILKSLGLSAHEIVAAPTQGIANQTWLCGEWVVRISKDPEYLEDLFTESVAAPAAVGAGIRTPAPISFCLQGQDGIPPYSVWQRVAGQTLSKIDSLPDPAQFFRCYGALLGQIHQVPKVQDELGYLDPAWVLAPDSLRIQAEEYGVYDVVAELTSKPLAYMATFVHQDLHADNVMVDHDNLPVPIDWGDASFGDPAADFRFVPAIYVIDVLQGYGEHDSGLLRRIALHVFDQYNYCRKHRRDFGVYGNSDWPSVESLLAQATRYQ